MSVDDTINAVVGSMSLPHLKDRSKFIKKGIQAAFQPENKDTDVRISAEKKEYQATAERVSTYHHSQQGITVEKQANKIEQQITGVAQGTVIDQDKSTASGVDRNQPKNAKLAESTLRCSFLVSRQTMPVHMLHPHPHRRHYPHHLLDHFSGNLTHHASPQVSWEQFLPSADTGSQDINIVASSQSEEYNETSVIKRNSDAKESIEREVGEQSTQSKPLSCTPLDSNVSYQTPQPWPFFGTESRVLPSGRKVSFLRQACLGFTRTNTKEPNRDTVTENICPKAFKEGIFNSFSSRKYIRTSSGTNVAELRKKFNQLAEQDTGEKHGRLDKFTNETVEGPLIEGTTSQQGRIGPRIETTPVIIDSSSTKGNHPIPKAPGLRSPGKETESEYGDNANNTMKIMKVPPALNRTDVSPGKNRKNSPIRKKEMKTTSSTTHAEAKANAKTRKKTKIVKPQPKTKVVSNDLPDIGRRANKNKRAGNQVLKTPISTAIKPITPRLDNDEYSTASESPCEGSSIVMVSAEDDITSTFEELSIDGKDISDRKFLVDYGDPSRFYFRNEWGTRMLEIEQNTKRMKEILINSCLSLEIQNGTLAILENVEALKNEMRELYDYFDHFEREEDTLLQQVQRQLMQANRYCSILQYRLERAEKHRIEDRRVKELEEEFKLSRQVAVSLHWELQTSDKKQEKLESENMTIRQRLLSAEASREVLKAKVFQLQNSIDHMSLHATSKPTNISNESAETSPDSATDMERQLLFLEEKEDIMLARLADLQREKDTLKDDLQQYKENYGELSSVSQSGASRQADLKLRLKLAEDQAGLLARKVMELQLENDNMIKIAAEKELLEKEVIHRNHSVSDLQFLEDERESLRLALDELEIENQKLAAELLRYKQAVHRQMHSNSSSTESPLDVGLMIRIPRSNESLIDEESKVSARSHKAEEKNPSHHDIVDSIHGDRNKSRPLSLNSPQNQTPKRLRLSLSRTLSDIAIPLSPDSNSGEKQITPVTTTISTPGSKSSLTNGSRKLSSQKSKRLKPIMIDVSAGEDKVYEHKTELCNKSIQENMNNSNISMRSQATSPMSAFIYPTIDVALQICEGNLSTKSQSTSPLVMEKRSFIPGAAPSNRPTYSSNMLSHSALMDEMRKQIACVRNIAESMDNVVDVEEMEAELERKGKEIVNAQYERLKEKSIRKRQLSKIAKTLQKHIKDIELSSSTSPTIRGEVSEVTGWNLHGNAEINTRTSENSEMSTITRLSSNSENLSLSSSVRMVTTNYHMSAASTASSQILEFVVLLVIAYVLMTSLPAPALCQICFLLFVFFIC